MACTLCRLPFWPHRWAGTASWPPDGMLSERQKRYFNQVHALEGNPVLPVRKCSFLDHNLFSPPGFSAMYGTYWETNTGAVALFHTACLNILRHVFGTQEYIPEHIAGLCMILHVLGQPLRGELHRSDGSVMAPGRWAGIDYAKTTHDPINVDAFYFKSPNCSGWKFAWDSFAGHGHTWALARPHSFPNFYHHVSPEEFPKPSVEAQTAPITRLPLDIAHMILPQLDIKSFCRLMSTCWTFRRHALTTFQPLAREHVLALQYALPTSAEYDAWLFSMTSSALVNPKDPPKGGDWMRYLVKVLNSDGMRARRRIWELAHEVHRVYQEKIVGTGWEDVVVSDGRGGSVVRKSAWRTDLENNIRRDLGLAR